MKEVGKKYIDSGYFDNIGVYEVISICESRRIVEVKTRRGVVSWYYQGPSGDFYPWWVHDPEATPLILELL
jgi:hypothetical protein